MKFLFVILFCVLQAQAYAQHDVPPSDGFEITGAVKRPLKFSISGLAGMRQDNLGDITIQNHKGDDKKTIKQLKGILLKILLDSAEITAAKPKEYNEYIILLTATDGYKNIYSWNELYNTEIGNHVYIITEMDGETISQMKDRILVMSLNDISMGRRHLKALSKIEVKKVQ